MIGEKDSMTPEAERKPTGEAVLAGARGSATCAWFDIRADNWRNFRNKPKCGKPASVTVRSVCGGIEMPLCAEHQAEYTGPDWIVTKLPNDPSSATASAGRVERTARSRTPATPERTAGRPFAAAHG